MYHTLLHPLLTRHIVWKKLRGITGSIAIFAFFSLLFVGCIPTQQPPVPSPTASTQEQQSSQLSQLLPEGETPLSTPTYDVDNEPIITQSSGDTNTFEGGWERRTMNDGDENTYTLTLRQNGERIQGYHCFVLRNATQADCAGDIFGGQTEDTIQATLHPDGKSASGMLISSFSLDGPVPILLTRTPNGLRLNTNPKNPIQTLSDEITLTRAE